MLRLITSTYKVKYLFQIFSNTKFIQGKIAIGYNLKMLKFFKILEIDLVSTWSKFIMQKPTIQNLYNWHIYLFPEPMRTQTKVKRQKFMDSFFKASLPLPCLKGVSFRVIAKFSIITWQHKTNITILQQKQNIKDSLYSSIFKGAIILLLTKMNI